MKIGFDSTKYIKAQKKEILERISKFEKLYLEFGGKLLYDLHATRVLPGYSATTKIDLLKQLDDAEIIYCVNANFIQKGFTLQDSKLTHDKQTIKDIEDIEKFGLKIKHVVITMYKDQQKIGAFKTKLKKRGISVYLLKAMAGYPLDTEKILKAYTGQPHIKTKKKLIIITGVGGGSGKMALALSQVYKERKIGVKAGFAKFETFPIWNLPLDHPINIAYEAATADLHDINMVDPFHKEAHKIKAINYNRDIENYSILKHLMKSITKEKNPFGYKSPTDMGVNMAKVGIVDDRVCREAAKKEVQRRYKIYAKQVKEGIEPKKTLERMREILKKI